MTTNLPSKRSKPLKLSEKQVTEQVIGWLKTKGWKCIRLQSGFARGVTGGTYIKLGQKHQADWICLRRNKFFFLELKATGKKPAPGQMLWMADRWREGMEGTWTNDLNRFVDDAMTRGWDRDLETYMERLEDVARAAEGYIDWSQGENGNGIQLMKSLTRAMGKLPPILPKGASK